MMTTKRVSSKLDEKQVRRIVRKFIKTTPLRDDSAGIERLITAVKKVKKHG